MNDSHQSPEILVDEYIISDDENYKCYDISTNVVRLLRYYSSNNLVEAISPYDRNNLNFRDWQGRTVAYWACRDNDYDHRVVKFMYEVWKLDFSVKTWDGKTCLMAAASTNNYHVCDYLLKNCLHIMPINEQDNRGNTALHHLFDLTFRENYPTSLTYELLKRMAFSGGNIHLPNNDGLSPLQLAFLTGCHHDLEKDGMNMTIAPVFYPELRHPGVTSTALLTFRALWRPSEIYLKCLERFVYSTYHDDEHNDMDANLVVARLIYESLEDSMASKTLLEFLDSELLKFGLKMMTEEFLSLIVRHLPVALELSRVRPIHENDDWKFFFMGLVQFFDSNKPSVLECIRQLCTINPTDPVNGKTLLHMACYWIANTKIYRNLVDFGVDVNARDYDGNTPLHDTFCLDEEIKNYLIQEGAHPDAVNSEGRLARRIDKPLGLQCLTARVVAISGKYAHVQLPSALKRMVNLHSEHDIYTT